MKLRLFAAKYKVTIALLIGATFLIVFLKNLADKHDNRNLALSFSAIYEDRLLVEGYLFEMANLMHSKKASISNSLSTKNDPSLPLLEHANDRINKLIKDYGKTKFTHKERIVFKQFQEEFRQINELEKALISGIKASELFNKYDNAIIQLHTLSAIQIAEADKLNRQSQQIFSGASLFTEVEFVGLILSCIAIQLLLATGNDRPKFPFNPGMN